MSQVGITFCPAATYCAAKYMTMKPTPINVRPSANFAGADGSRLRRPKLTHSAANTGENTMTGGRLKRVKEYLRNEEAFCFTYGDGVADVNIAAQVAFHREHGKAATITAVQPPGRYGALQLDGTKVTGFTEKPRGDGGLINGGFFVLAPGCIDYIDGDESSWEGKPLAALAAAGQMQAFEHRGFWQPMDTLREKNLLEELWSSGKAPWKIW